MNIEVGRLVICRRLNVFYVSLYLQAECVNTLHLLVLICKRTLKLDIDQDVKCECVTDTFYPRKLRTQTLYILRLVNHAV